MILIEKHIIRKEIVWLVYREKKKKTFMVILILAFLTENKTFWKTVKPFLAEKSKKVSKITLIEDNQIISQDNEYI